MVYQVPIDEEVRSWNLEKIYYDSRYRYVPDVEI